MSQYLIDLVTADLARAGEQHAWDQFAAYYTDPQHVSAARAESEAYRATLADGLADEDWSHLA